MVMILVVEDNPFTRKTVRVALEQRGYHVVEADRGDAAIRGFQSQVPDLILQDLVLPDMDGFDLVARLRGLPGGDGVPILAFSALVSKVDEGRIASAGFDDLIVKPIEPARLIPALEAHLAAPSPLEQFGTGHHLVLADDDPSQLKLTRFRLERVGFSVAATSDGEDALAAVRAQRPTCVVADVLMPRLDGFGLAMAVRAEPAVADLPILLVTSSYVDVSDRDLARRAGANDLIVRTPDHRELIEALRGVVHGSGLPFQGVQQPSAGLEQARAGRVVRQLERQVTLNTGLARRCSLLAAELAVLTGISEAVIRHENVDRAFDEVLAGCLDVGGISVGALYLCQPKGKLKVQCATGTGKPGPAALSRFFGREHELRAAIAGAEVITVPSGAFGGEWAEEVLAQCAADFALLVPLVHRGGPLGALFIAVKSDDLDRGDWLIFAQGIGNQLAQSIELASTFAEKERAERRAKEKADLLRVSEERFRATFEQAAVGVAHVAPEGRWLDVNQKLCDIVGYSRDELLSSTFQDITFVEDLDTDLDRVRQVLSGEVQTYTLEKRYVRKNGDLVWIDLTVSLVRDATGQPKYFISVIQDISARKTAEAEARVAQALRHANEELEAAYKELQATQAQLIQSAKMASLGELVAGIAHEINNPLAFVVSHVDTARKSLDRFKNSLTESISPEGDEEFSRATSRLKETAMGLSRIRDLVVKLRTFSRLDEGERKRTSVKESIDAVATILAHRAAGRIEIKTQCAADDEIECYPALLNQVLLNLVANSIDAVPGAGTVTIDAGAEGSEYVIRVTDTGVGIPPELRHRILEPFFTTKEVGEGTGLGLSITDSIVKKHDGTLTLDDAPGGGTVAVVRIPTRRARG